MILEALILSVALQFVDAATTIWILEHGGVELNPVMAPIIRRYGVRLVMPLKALAIALVLGGCWSAGFFEPAPWAAYFIAILSILVVASNLATIARMRRT